MLIKEFLTKYVYCTDVMYDTQYLRINNVGLAVNLHTDEIHPLTGELIDEFDSCMIFTRQDTKEIVAIIFPQNQSYHDMFDDWCENELEI